MRVFLFILFFVFAATGRVEAKDATDDASFFSGDMLFKICDSSKASDEAFCDGFLLGIGSKAFYDGYLYKTAKSETFRKFISRSAACPSIIETSPSPKTLRKSFDLLLTRHPSRGEVPAWLVVSMAFRNTWPCK